MKLIHRSILTCALMSGTASLAFMMMGAPGVRAQTVQGADGANAIDGDPDVPATSGESVTATGSSASATGGNGGNGGNDFNNGQGEQGGDATATAATIVISGSAEADATAIGGNGGNAGFNGGVQFSNNGNGGNASASSTAVTNGSGDASSSANATGGAMGNGDFGFAGSASAVADAAAAGGGKAVATAFATGGPPAAIVAGFSGAANATSNARTVNGAMADAQSIAVPGRGGQEQGQASSTAKTSFAGVSVEATATAPNNGGGPTGAVVVAASTDAIAQGGSGQSPVNPGQFDGLTFSTALPNTAYATALIGSASNVADALLGPDDKIFGSAILEGIGDSSTFDFSFRGDLILGVIAGGFFEIVANGADILSEDVGDNTIINLGSIFGPNIDLTIEGDGVFAIGGAVPEPSTWAMMLIGFAGLGYASYRATQKSAAQAA